METNPLMFWQLYGPGKNIPDDFAGKETPKHKFNFTIQFFPRADVVLSEDGTGAVPMEAMKFALKTATRPAPQVNMQNFNFYNYHHNVAKFVEYGTVTVSFYDDNTNRAQDLYSKYFEGISPIANDRNSAQADNYDKNGPTFASNLKHLEGNRHGPFKSIKVTHWYKNSGGGAAKSTTFDYANPQIISADLDTLDMSESAVTLVTLTYSYDGVSVTNS